MIQLLPNRSNGYSFGEFNNLSDEQKKIFLDSLFPEENYPNRKDTCSYESFCDYFCDERILKLFTPRLFKEISFYASAIYLDSKEFNLDSGEISIRVGFDEEEKLITAYFHGDMGHLSDFLLLNLWITEKYKIIHLHDLTEPLEFIFPEES